VLQIIWIGFNFFVKVVVQIISKIRKVARKINVKFRKRNRVISDSAKSMGIGKTALSTQQSNYGYSNLYGISGKPLLRVP